MVKRSFALMLTAAALTTRCFPGPLDATGKRCEATRPCGDGFVCFDDVCFREGEVDAGPDNWLPNGDFELFFPDGGCPGWVAKPGKLTEETVNPHGGHSAVRLWGQRGDGGNAPAMVPLVALPDPKSGQTWCVEAWLRTVPTDAGFNVQLTIRETLDGGAQRGPTATSRTIGRDWVRLENSYTPTVDGVSLDARIGFGVSPGNTTDAIIVDDLRLKRSATDTCLWP